jgi:hypothetical protein
MGFTISTDLSRPNAQGKPALTKAVRYFSDFSGTLAATSSDARYLNFDSCFFRSRSLRP